MPSSPPQPQEPSQHGAWALIALCIVGLLAHGFYQRFLCDDAYITFRYARNVAAGNGLVFNPGEHVEGFSNFLWMLQLAVIAALGGTLSEVGAVMMVGGNLEGETRVLTTSILMFSQMGEYEVATALAVMLTDLVDGDGLDLAAMIAALSWRPAAIGGLVDHGRPIQVGEPANLAVFDPNRRWTVRGSDMASPSRNTPYEGRTLSGRVRHTVFRGEPVVVNEEARR